MSDIANKLGRDSFKSVSLWHCLLILHIKFGSLTVSVQHFFQKNYEICPLSLSKYYQGMVGHIEYIVLASCYKYKVIGHNTVSFFMSII